jgi:hypothetical protein
VNEKKKNKKIPTVYVGRFAFVATRTHAGTHGARQNRCHFVALPSQPRSCEENHPERSKKKKYRTRSVLPYSGVIQKKKKSSSNTAPKRRTIQRAISVLLVFDAACRFPSSLRKIHPALFGSNFFTAATKPASCALKP